MGLCDGRIAIVTGAGRGVGRAYALMLAAQGAKVVVNDLGGEANGDGGADPTPGQAVVAEIVANGGQAIANGADVADWEQAKAMIDRAVEAFGGLDIVVNNAGVLRDRMMTNLTEEDWDIVTRVNLKGTFAPSHHAANYWRTESKAGRQRDARLINTSSGSGLFGNIGQANYAAAKAGVASFSVVTARELARIGVTVNCIAPRAQSRMTAPLTTHLSEDVLARRDPEWIATLVTWLASTAAKDVTGRVFEAWGFGYSVAQGWQHGPIMDASRDPTTIESGVRQILAAAADNAGIERDQWFVP